MTLLLSLSVDVVPVAQPRQRAAVVGGRARTYLPAEHPVHAYKATLRLAAQEAMRRQGLPVWDGPVILAAGFFLPRPRRLNSSRWPEAPIPHTGRPDLDNLLKATTDALLGVVWRDDAQVHRYGPGTGKWYHERDGRPRVELEVWALDDPELVAAVARGRRRAVEAFRQAFGGSDGD